MTEFASLIDAIRQRPGMYFGSKSLTAFYHFLGGYQMACGLHQIEDDQLGLKIPPDFHDWVAYRTHFRESTSGWCNMIVETTDSEELAFDRFFELLEDHANRKPNVVARLRNSKKTYSTQIDGEDRTIPYPESIALITYTEDPGFFAISEVEGGGFPFEGFLPSLDWFETFVSPETDSLEIIDREAFAKLKSAQNKRMESNG